MIIKKFRSTPRAILKLEALTKRLIPNHPEMNGIESELARRHAGYYGEQSLDYFMEHLPYQEGYYLLQDLRLPISDQVFFQIDTLLLTAYRHLIFEGKNIAGELFFDPNQLMRTLHDKMDIYPDPITQVQNQQYFLNILLERYSIPLVPSHTFVVVTNPKSIIKPNPKYPAVAKQVIRPAAIRSTIDSIIIRNQQPILNKKAMDQITELLIKLHTPEDPDILAQYKINKDEILPGIFCENCSKLSVVKQNKVWKCKICGKNEEQGIIRTLIDYRLLMGPTITNKDLRTFIGEPSIYAASRTLRSLNLPSTGKYKDRVYTLDLEHLLSLLKK